MDGSSDPTIAAAPRAPLAAAAERLGAVRGELEDGGVMAVRRYGELEREYQALRCGCGLVDLSWMGGMEMTGADRARFLNAYITCDVKNLAAGEGAYGFLTSPQGRILADLTVLALADRFWIELPPGREGAVAEHLRKFLIADRVEMRDLGGVVPLGLLGPEAEAVLAGASSGEPLPERPRAHAARTLLGAEVRVERRPPLPAPGFTLWVEGEGAAAEVAEGLLGARGATPVGLDALEVARVEGGVPRFGRDFGAQNFPQETGVADAVSYTKGCYLGQEVVARIHYRGGVQKTLRGLVFGGQAPAPGTPLLYEGREAGVATSVVHSLALGVAAGLSILHRRAAAPGTRLQWSAGGAQGEAEVRELPLV